MVPRALTLLLLLLAQPAAAGDEPLTLAGCVERALAEHPDTRAAWAAVQSADAAVSVAKGAWLPTADLDVDAGAGGALGAAGPTADPGVSAGARISVGYVLFDGGRRGTVDAARARLEQMELRHRAVLLDVALDVEEAWLGLQGALWARDAVEELVRQAAWQHALAEARSEVGLARRYDVVQAVASLRQAEVLRTTSGNGVVRARGDLARAMGLDPQTAPQIAAQAEDAALSELPPVDRLAADALAHRPELAEARSAISEALAATRVAEAGHLPVIRADASLGGSWDSRADLTGPWNVGVGLTLPLFRGLRTKHTIRGARFDEERARAQLAGLVTDVQFEVWAAHTAARDAAATEEAGAALLAAADEATALAEEGYKAGTGTIGEVLDAQAGRAAVRLDLLQARLDRLLAVARLQRAVGRVLSGDGPTTDARLTP